MKLKVTLHRPSGDNKDLLVTADAATTVGDLGHFLALSDPTHRSDLGPDDEVTVSIVRDGVLTLDARTPLSESPIKSGSTVALAPAGQKYSERTKTTVAEATAIAGPHRGKTFELTPGTNIIGRQRSCEVCLDKDAMVSRSHARLNVSDHIEIIDLGSANGLELNGSLVSRATVRPTDEIRLGDTVLNVRLTHVASLEGRTDASSVGFIRSPRLAPQFVGQEFEVPDLPQAQEKAPFPALLMVFPLLMAGVMYYVTRQWQTVIFATLMPLMMVASWWEGRRRAEMSSRAAVALFRADLDDIVDEAGRRAVVEIGDRQREYPSAVECLSAVAARNPLLWTRRPHDWGFLELRAGLGESRSRSTVKLPSGKSGRRDLLHEARTRTAHLGTVAPVPVVLRPRETGGIGVAGPRAAAIGSARGLVVQAAALHSPAELAIALVTGQRNGSDWDWLKWLPHVDSTWTPIDARHMASTPGSAASLVSAIENLIAERSAEHDGPQVPAVLLVVESDSPLEFGRLVDVAEHGWQVGIHVLWVAPEVDQLPAACRNFMDVRTLTESGVGFVHDAELVTPVQTEPITHDQAQQFARSIAPLIDLGAPIQDVSDLPRSISFLAMDGYGALGDQPEAVIERWTQNHSILTGPRAGEPSRKEASLRAPIGQTAGHMHHVDLRSDGPHALVGGTTGAGKSELLQSWILSMAATYSPQRLTFLLVDYKGGSAFADCSKLPHTVGMVTDLNPNGVQRALASLSAELRFREKVLDKAKAKDLMTLEKRGAVDAPPSLVIVVDEFAALIKEVPEFVEGVVNVAQRGRSLGLHLILATQQPAGVIKDNLRANTNLRMALRVADEADSVDVLDSPDAALFDPNLPGRAMSKTGPGRLVPFQTAYAGGHTGSGPIAPDIRVEELVLGPGIEWEVPLALAPRQTQPLGKSDITRVVDNIQAATVLADIQAPRKPWLPDLATALDVTSLPQLDAQRGQLAFGLMDKPDDQAQVPVAFDPDREGNLAIFGASGSGKSTAMRTLAVAAGLTFQHGRTWIYGLDFGAGGLGMLDALPHVGSIVPGSDDERVRRLLRWLRGIIEDRTDRFSAVNADSITKFRRSPGGADEPRILVLLDGIGAFLKAFETDTSWIDLLVDLASKGRQLGVHFVISADRSGAFTTQLAATIQRRLVLRMTSTEDYDNLSVRRTILTSDSPPGRGVWSGLEVQVGILGDAWDLGAQAAQLQRLARWMSSSDSGEAPEIQHLPELVPLGELPVRVGELLVIGVADETLGPLSIRAEGTFAVMGPPGSGRTSALRTIARAVRRASADSTAYLFTLDRRSPLLRETLWSESALGADDAQLLAERLALDLDADLDHPMVIVVDRISEWAGSFAELSLETLIKAAVRAGAFVVTDGEASSFGRNFGLESVANASRVGFALAPESGDGAGFGVRLPLRLNKADFPPGRGFLFRSGRPHLGHLALAEESE